MPSFRLPRPPSAPWAAVLFFGLALAVFGPGLRAPFLFDEVGSVQDNPHVRSLWPLSEAMAAPRATSLSGRPLTALSFALSRRWSGGDPFRERQVNLALHALVGAVLYAAARIWLRRVRPGTAPSWSSLGLALLWLLHPIQTEPALYLIVRAETLWAGFGAIAVLASLKATLPGRSMAPAWLALSGVACAAAIASKETALCLPPLILILHLILQRSSASVTPLSTTPAFRIFLPVLFALWLLLTALVIVGERGRDASGNALEAIGPLQYAAIQTGVVPHYLAVAFLLKDPCLDYDDWPSETAPLAALVRTVLLGAALGAAIWFSHRDRATAAACVAGFLLTLLPTSSVFPITEFANDRRFSVPLFFLLGGLGILGGSLLSNLPARSASARVRWVAGTGVVAAILLLATLSHARARLFAEPVALWAHTVLQRPANARAHYNLAAELARRGRLDAALPHLYRSAELAPNRGEVHSQLAAIAWRAGNVEQARDRVRRALAGDVEYYLPRLKAQAWMVRGLVAAREGRFEEAWRACRRAFLLDPELPGARQNLETARTRLGRTVESTP